MSATEPADKNDPSLPPGKPAAALVNAVVNAYRLAVGHPDCPFEMRDDCCLRWGPLYQGLFHYTSFLETLSRVCCQISKTPKAILPYS